MQRAVGCATTRIGRSGLVLIGSLAFPLTAVFLRGEQPAPTRGTRVSEPSCTDCAGSWRGCTDTAAALHRCSCRRSRRCASFPRLCFSDPRDCQRWVVFAGLGASSPCHCSSRSSAGRPFHVYWPRLSRGVRDIPCFRCSCGGCLCHVSSQAARLCVRAWIQVRRFFRQHIRYGPPAAFTRLWSISRAGCSYRGVQLPWFHRRNGQWLVGPASARSKQAAPTGGRGSSGGLCRRRMRRCWPACHSSASHPGGRPCLCGGGAARCSGRSGAAGHSASRRVTRLRWWGGRRHRGSVARGGERVRRRPVDESWHNAQRSCLGHSSSRCRASRSGCCVWSGWVETLGSAGLGPSSLVGNR